MPSHSLDSRMDTLAQRAREILGIPYDERLSAVDLLARMKIAGLIRDWFVVPDDALPRANAMWDGSSVIVRRGVFSALVSGDADANFTIFHELAHCLLGHRPRNRGTAGKRQQFGRYVESDESAADWLAGALMAPEYLAQVDQTTKVAEVAQRFHMPLNKATVRLNELQRRHRHRTGLVRPIPSLAEESEPDSYHEAIAKMMQHAEPRPHDH